MSLGHGASVVKSGLVLHLDAANKKSYPGTGTAWTDLSGNSNNGTLVNGVGYSTNNNGYMSFDYTNDVVNVSDSNTLSFVNNIFTIDFWVYFNAVNITQGVIGKRGWEYSIHTTGTNTLFFYAWSTPGNDVYLRSVSIQANTWYNFSWVANGTQNLVYTNGVAGAPGNKSANNMGNTNVALTIGRGGEAVTGDAFMNGRVGATKFYNRALSIQEVQQNFEALRGRYGI